MRIPRLAFVMVMATMTATSCDDSKSSADGGGGTGGSGGAGGTATGGTTGGTATGGTGGATGGSGGAGGAVATGGTGGAGGTAGTGGMGGSAGTGGTGGASATCEIPCLTSLVSNCVPMGSCMSQLSLNPIGTNQCYSNGVKVTSAINLVGGGTSGTAVITYRKDGNVCYSIEVPVTTASQSFMFTYKNAAGMAVATGNFDSTTNKTTVMCGAMTYDLSSAACANIPRGMPAPGTGGTGGTDSCPMGTCP